MATKAPAKKKTYDLQTTEGQAAHSAELIEQAKREEESKRAFALTIAAPADLDLTKLERRGMPTLIKPDMIPVNSVVSAQIMGVFKSPVSTVKGLLLHLKAANATEFTFPLTGVIRNALAPGVRDDDGELKATVEKEIGKMLVMRRNPDKPSKFKKQMFMFDVFTSPAPALDKSGARK